MIRIKNLFPSSILQGPVRLKGYSIVGQNKELLREIRTLQREDLNGQRWSRKFYPHGYTSFASLDKLHTSSSLFENLKTQIDKEVLKFAKHLEMDLHRRKLFMTNFWINIMPANAAHGMHIHPLSTISGTYYVQTPANCSSLKLEDPRMESFMASLPRKTNARDDNQRYIYLQPKAGDLILFESWMRHEVPVNLSRRERISLSFNYDWV